MELDGINGVSINDLRKAQDIIEDNMRKDQMLIDNVIEESRELYNKYGDEID